MCLYFAAILPLKCSRHSWKQQRDVLMQSAMIRAFMIVLWGNCCALNCPYLSHLFSLLCFLLTSPGPRLGNSPVQSIVQCLARKDGTDDFYQLKVSTLDMVLMLLTISECKSLSTSDEISISKEILIPSRKPSHGILKMSRACDKQKTLFFTLCMNLWPASINLHNTSMTLLLYQSIFTTGSGSD